jgi:hypothetical protein
MFNRTQRASLLIHWEQNRYEQIVVQYNPAELTFEKSVQVADIDIPGLDAPLKQFVSGQNEKLTFELFFDSTEDGTGSDAKSVTEATDAIYQLTKIVPTTHAPPIVTFRWGGPDFPGAKVSEANLGGDQRRTSFKGIVESVRQRFTLFSPDGKPLRATLTVTMAEFKTLDEQLQQLNLNSPDRTHAHIVESGETLDSISARYYERPGAWRRIADANGLEDPRRLSAGTFLHVRPIR